MQEQFDKPDFANALDEDLDAIRDNYHFLTMVAASGSIVLPGWQTTVTATDYSEPDTITLTRGTKRIIINYTWNADGSVATIQLCYDDGVSSPGLTCFDAIPLYYDDYGNVTGTSNLPPVSSDASILWGNAPTEIECFYIDSEECYPQVYFRESGLGARVYERLDGVEDLIYYDSIDGSYYTGEYLVKFEVVETVSGTNPMLVNYSTSGEEGNWWDAYRHDLRLTDEDDDGVPQKKVVKVWMATDNGAGAPVAGTETWKLVTFTANYRTP